MNYTTVSASGNSFKGLKTLIEMLAPNGTSLPVDPPYVERGSLFVLKGADPSQDKIYLSDGAGGWTLASGSPGVGGTIDSIIPGANITIDATDPANPIISATMINQTGKYLIGGGAQWSGTGYNYDVTANYYFNGSFNVGPVNLTLSAPDAINDRFDAFVADDAGNITTIEGTAAATPVTPAIPDNQLLIQYVFVQHGTTAPALTQENIYLENTEWTGANYTTSGTQVGTTNFDATDLPKQGTKCIDNLLDGRTGIRFNKGATIDVSSYSQLSLWVRLGNAATSKQKLNVQFENSSLAPTGNAIDLFQYGIQRGTLGTWQLAVVDISLFGVTSVQGFRMILTGGTNGTQYGWDVDLMILTNGSAPVIVSPTISFFKDGAKIADESAIDIIAGAGMTITAVDDPVNKRVKYTFSAASSGGGGGDVDSVTGLNTDNTDPANPVVKISVDGTTITGQGTSGDPLVSVGGAAIDDTTSAADKVYSSLKTQNELDGKLPDNGWTVGDLFYADASGNIQPLAKGSDGNVLELGSGLPFWNGVNAANQLLRLDGTGKLPALDASQLINLPFVGWTVGGNTIGAIGRLGTLDNYDFKIIRNNEDKIQFTSNEIIYKNATRVTLSSGFFYDTGYGSPYIQNITGSGGLLFKSFTGSKSFRTGEGSASYFYGVVDFGTRTCSPRMRNVNPNQYIFGTDRSGTESATTDAFFDIVAGGYALSQPVHSNQDIRIYTINAANGKCGNIILAYNGTTQLGRVGIGLEIPNVSALLDVSSTTKGFLPPRMTTTNWGMIASKAEGLQGWSNDDHGQLWFDGTNTIGFRYNRTTSKFQGFDGTSWIDLN